MLLCAESRNPRLFARLGGVLSVELKGRIESELRKYSRAGVANVAWERQKKWGLAREKLPLEECSHFTSDAMCRSPMSSELNADLETPRRRTANGAVRLSPLPPRNTLLTVVFFSALALAIGYWIFFPPVATTPPETTAAPNAQPALRD